MYKGIVKEPIAFNCMKDEFVLDKILTIDIIDIFDGLLSNSPKEKKPNIAFFLLYNMRQKKISFVPELKPLLDKISWISEDSLLQPHFEILSYLKENFEEITAEQAALYMCHIYQSNKLDKMTYVSSVIIELIEQVLKSTSTFHTEGNLCKLYIRLCITLIAMLKSMLGN